MIRFKENNYGILTTEQNNNKVTVDLNSKKNKHTPPVFPFVTSFSPLCAFFTSFHGLLFPELRIGLFEVFCYVISKRCLICCKNLQV